MSTRPLIQPEHCPEPFWHDTHRYCPVCTWMEPAEPKVDWEMEWHRLIVQRAAVLNQMEALAADLECPHPVEGLSEWRKAKAIGVRQALALLQARNV